MYLNRKHFIFFIVLLVTMVGLVSAADTNDPIQTDTSNSNTNNILTNTHENIEVENGQDTYNPEDYNVQPNNKNNKNNQNNTLNNEHITDYKTDTIQKKSTVNVKTQQNNNITIITEENYNNYLSVSGTGIVKLKQEYFKPGNNYTINFTYFPTEAKQLSINNFYNNKYKNDTITITGSFNNIYLQLDKAGLKSLNVEDIVVNYDKNYTGEYVNTPGINLNHLTINVDTQRNSSVNVLTVGENSIIEKCTINVNSSGNTPTNAININGENATIRNCIINANITSNKTSSPIYIGGQHAVVENCTINACLPSSQIDWFGNSVPKGMGIWVNAFYVTLRNNKININESCVLDDGTHRSLYGIYVRGINTDVYNNSLLLEGTQYTYGIVIRASQNKIYNNNITVKSVYYSAGVNIEGNGMKNNYIHDNFINVSAGFEQTDQGNPDVAYACLILDFNCNGENYEASITSMENNRYINNTIYADARQSYGFELWGGVNTQISGNNMTVTGNYPMGIGVVGINTTMNNNIIYAEGKSNETEYSADYIKPRTAGIYVYGKNDGNSITNNTIATSTGRALQLDKAQNTLIENNFLLTENYDYVIEVNNQSNTFKNNALIGEGTTSEVIKDTTSNNTYINNREPTNSTLTVTPETLELNKDNTITLTLTDAYNKVIPGQYINVKLGKNEAQTVITDDQGKCTLHYTPQIPEDKITLNADYQCYENYGTKINTELPVNGIIKLTPENYNTYITDGKFNEKVASGTYIDVSGKFDDERYAFTVNKPVNIISSSGDAFFCFYSTPKVEGTSELPDYSFIINSEGSGSNITDIQFENTMIVTTEAHDITFDNITSYCTSGYGWGRGSTSIRNSQNVTIKNSYFNTTDNNGVSTVVFAGSQNCLLENSTVVGSGFIGNLVYATTYNVEVNDTYGNNNITIRGNKIIGRNLQLGSATCYSVCVIGNNITVENNYIENSNKYLIMTQYKDDAYEVAGSTGGLTIRNNSFGPGKIGVTFNPCTITDNTFYGNVTLEVTNTTIQANNTNKEENENPYTHEETSTRHPTKITINAPNNYIYEENTQFTITITDQTNQQKINKGYLEVYSDGTLYKNITINQDTTTFTYNNKEIGPHHIRVWYYTPDENIENTQKLHTIEAQKITGQLKLETKNNPEIGETITLKVTYTLNKNKNHQSNITFELPGQKPITLQTVNNSATLETTITTDYIKNILGGREQNIKITANTNDTNIEITGLTTKLGVKPATTNIEITPDKTKIGQTTTITATIKTPNNTTINTGTITFTDEKGNTISTVNVQNNKATTTITYNNTGNTQINAAYTETIHYKASNKTTTINVEKYNTKITSTASTAKYGEKTTITGKLTDENNKAINNADILITINGVQNKVTTNNNGEYTLNTNINKVGQNTTTITYNGNTNYNPTSTTTTINVNKQDTLVTINSIPATKYTQNVTITGTLKDKLGNNIPNANIKLSINNKETIVTTNNQGTYIYTTTATTTGTNTIIITYDGNTNYNSANTQATFTVNKQDTKITINTKNVKYGETVTITGKLADENKQAISNTDITLTLNNNKHNIKTNNNGEYTYTTTATTIGTNNVTVTYNGNSNYNPTSTTTTINVNKQDTLVTINNIPATKYTESVTITGTLKDKNGKTLANQNLKLSINGKTVTVKTDKNGAYSYKHTTNTVGSNNLTVTFTGNNNYNSANTRTTFTVNKQDTTITLNNIKSTYTSNATITGKLTTKDGKILANQNMNLNINGKTVTVKTDKNGIFSYKYQTNKVGTNNITLTYTGNGNYQGTSLRKTFTVSKLDLKITINKITTVAYGEKIIIKGTFKDKNGKILGNSKLKLNINGKTATIKTDKNGIFTYKHTTRKVGTNNITISHAGTKNYNKITKKATFKVTKQNLKITLNRTNKVGYGSKVYVKGQLTDKHGKTIKNTVITININGKIIRAKTNSKGIYNHSLTTTKLGTNNITVTYPGNKNYNKITKKATFKVTKQTVKITTNTKQVKGSKKVTITGKLTTKDGKALRNSKVTLTINGKKKTAKTNNKGAYTLTVAGKTGKNTLIASFTGNKYYNKYTGAKKVFSIA